MLALTCPAASAMSSMAEAIDTNVCCVSRGCRHGRARLPPRRPAAGGPGPRSSTGTGGGGLSGTSASSATLTATRRSRIARFSDRDRTRRTCWMVEVLVRWEPGRLAGGPPIEGPLDVPLTLTAAVTTAVGGSTGGSGIFDGSRSLAPTSRLSRQVLLGTLQRHGLVVRNDNTSEAIKRYQGALERAMGKIARRNQTGVPRVNRAGDLAPEPTWSPTELGEQVFLRFRDAGMKLKDVWTSGPAGVYWRVGGTVR